MSDTAQGRALKAYRKRLGDRGIARFEVLGRDVDRAVIRALARRLADGGPGAARARNLVQQAIADEPDRKGGILAALRSSPLVGAELDLTRPKTRSRKVDL